MNSIMMGVLILQGGGLVISEIMPDPEPVVGLPPYEYVEWYNRGTDTVELAGWQWVAGDKSRKLPGGRIAPGSFAIICSPAAAAAFRPFGQVIAIESFPSLLNSGERLSLVDPAGTVAHSVEYASGQYTDALKAGGGWSLELADLTNYCNPDAWMTSADPSGGTPGRANSLSFNLPPPVPPRLIRAAGFDDRRFVILFSGSPETASDMNIYSCLLSPGAIQAKPAISPQAGFPGLFFNYPEDIDLGLIYRVEFQGNLTDCTGQEAILRPVLLGFPSAPDSADIVISEVMFDPLTGQPEFVEVYNRSERVIDLKDLILARANDQGNINNFSDDQPVSYWLFPRSYAVFTADGKGFGKAWPSSDPAAVAERTDMPSLTNETSQLILLDRNQKTLDVAIYSPDWHYPYLDDTKGVSLERISMDAPGTDRSNWFSAAGSVGGSTPGMENSSARNLPDTETGSFSLSPVTGYATSADPVRITVSYRFENPGYFMKVNVFSATGMPVRELFPFGLAGVQGVVCWDGLDGELRMVPEGIYLIVAEFYHPSGTKGRWKKACALVRDY